MRLRSVKLKGWMLWRGIRLSEKALEQAVLENRKQVRRAMLRLSLSEDRLYCAAYAWAGKAAHTLGGLGAHDFTVTVSSDAEKLREKDQEAIEFASALLAAAGNHDAIGPYELWRRMDGDMQIDSAFHVLGMAAAAMKATNA